MALKDITNEVLEPISYYSKGFDDTFTMFKHSHPYIEIMVCKSGTFLFEVEKDGQFVTLAVTQGELVFIDAHVFHRILFPKGVKAHIFNIEFEVKSKNAYNPFQINDAVGVDFAAVRKGSPGLSKLAALPKGYAVLSDTGNAGGQCQKLLDTLDRGINSFEDAYAVKLGILDLFIELGKCCAAGAESGIAYVRRAVEYIKQNFTGRITTDEVAAHAGVNKSYLQRLFKAQLGTTVVRLANHYRVEKCKKLLSSTNAPIESICAETGFENRQNLIYQFKAFTGESPSAYRRHYADKHIDHHTQTHNSICIED